MNAAVVVKTSVVAQKYNLIHLHGNMILTKTALLSLQKPIYCKITPKRMYIERFLLI